MEGILGTGRRETENRRESKRETETERGGVMRERKKGKQIENAGLGNHLKILNKEGTQLDLQFKKGSLTVLWSTNVKWAGVYHNIICPNLLQ